MNCPFCTSHTRTIKTLQHEEVEWCYGCGTKFKIVIYSREKQDPTPPADATVLVKQSEAVIANDSGTII